MANGNIAIGRAPSYEDYASLKKYLRKNRGGTWKEFNLSRFMFNQAGTGSFVEVEDKGTETIADIGKTAETWIAQISAHAENVVLTITWVDNAGTETTQSVTLTDANETAFTVPITTGYACTAASIDVVNPGGVTVKVGVTGLATPVATVAAAATVATEALLSGTGKVMAQTMVDDATQHGKDVYLDYVTPWGAIKYGFATLDGADSSTEVVWYEASSVYTATTVLVKDFYRRRDMTCEANSVATKEIALVAVIYSIIGALQHSSMHSRFTTPMNRDCWLARVVMTVSVATKIVTQLKITFTPYGDTDEHNIVISVGDYLLVDPCIRLAANTDLKFEIIGNLTDNTFNIHVLEAIQV